MTHKMLVLGILIWLAPMLVGATEHCDTQHALARVDSIEGSVTLNESLATPSAFLCAGDVLRTAARSRAVVRLLNTKSVARLDQSSQLRFLTPTPPEDNRSLLDLLKGAVYFFSREPRSLDVRTPFISAGVEGTEFLVRVEPDRSLVSVFEGQVAAVNDKGRLSIGSGQSVSAAAGDKPRLVTVVRPRDAVQWALYYQPILTALVDASADGEMIGLPAAVRGAISRGELTEAFNALEGVPTAQRDEDYHVVRAGLLLAVGRVEQARMAIEQAFAVNPASSQGRALQAIIAVTRNDKAGAFSLASEAVSLDARSVAARLALSYAQQAQFDLSAALESVQAAVAANPQNALAWARLAELWLTQSELDRSLESAQRAVALSPDLSHTQTVLGFAHLTQIKTAEAKQAFNRAIELDQAAPLPRLGLGLAKIREGELETGREELEIAVSLDPDNSLYRSYMGKAYYEEKRNALATAQYEMAKGLDPLDPTPWLYEALLKQTENRPVEALSDLQQSIELNDNRAVYRSRLLLDEDEATRGANLGRIYEDLGFEQLALNEGSRSLATDPANHSAHRFLANTYAKLPRHEIARDSELLQSQLLQPVNINPVQPINTDLVQLQLADIGLVFSDDPGLGGLGLSDFSRLFTANQLRLQAEGIAGSNGTRGDNLVLSGIHNNISYSLGQFHFETDGFRENNDQTHDIYSALVQVNLSPQTSVQAEARWAEKETGFLSLSFFPEDFLSSIRTDFISKSIRLGFRHSFSPNSTLISSYVYRELDSDADLIPILNLKADDNAHFLETRYLHQTEQFNITGGLGYYDSDFEDMIVFESRPPDITRRKDRRVNGYIYSTVGYLENVQFILGVSADSFERGVVKRNQINPKLGVIWDITPETSFRAAAFRVLKRPIVSNQTLEVTQIAGFNQFFDDVDGTDSRRYGIAIDHKLTPKLFIGTELSKRDLALAIPLHTSVEDVDWEEKLSRAYLYWTPSNQLAVSAEYQYERFVRDEPLGSGLAESTTHKMPLEVRFFHPSGLFGRGRLTYVNQKGRFSNSMGFAIPGKDSFSIADAALGYRFPNRLGLVSLEARNLFDENFNFQDSDPEASTFARERLILIRFALALP